MCMQVEHQIELEINKMGKFKGLLEYLINRISIFNETKKESSTRIMKYVECACYAVSKVDNNICLNSCIVKKNLMLNVIDIANEIECSVDKSKAMRAIRTTCEEIDKKYPIEITNEADKIVYEVIKY